MKNVIHIFGASGSGTTTLGKKICSELGYTLMDTDAYYWIPTEPPFKLKRSANERIELMKNDINKSANVVISGSLADWGDVEFFEWAKSYDSGGAEIRSKARHDQWQKKLSCRVLHLDGEAEIDEKFKKVSEALGLFEKRT